MCDCAENDILRIAAKLQQPTETQSVVGDMDGNGKVNSSDARKVLRIAARLDPTPEKKHFPAG